VERPLHLTSDRVAIDLAADQGGRIAQLWVDGTAILVGRDAVPDPLRMPDGTPAETAWGAFPMVPWAGRIRRGRFTFRGREYQLPTNDGRHAIHGVGFSAPWSVTVERPELVRLALELPSDDRWPFGGHAVHEVSVSADRILLRMDVTAGDHAFPVSFGWHPWFRTPSLLDFHPARMYRRDDEGITVDELVDVSPGPWDDCFTNSLPVSVTVDGVHLQLTSDCTHWVVYDEMPHATCVEPQTGPPDAFTIAPRILEPGEPHSAWFQIRVIP
jgi:aldose 1-epimerase